VLDESWISVSESSEELRQEPSSSRRLFVAVAVAVAVAEQAQRIQENQVTQEGGVCGEKQQAPAAKQQQQKAKQQQQKQQQHLQIGMSLLHAKPCCECQQHFQDQSKKLQEACQNHLLEDQAGFYE
jgi:hypothetical protein